ncbi:MAG: hypothetical protein ABI772_06110 [Bacteroidota bacterium]
MVEVFKTNVVSKQEASLLVEVLQKKYPHAKINFDLDDCDRILRMKGFVEAEEVEYLLTQKGYYCKVIL